MTKVGIGMEIVLLDRKKKLNSLDRFNPYKKVWYQIR